jgi:hypothetical protein
MMVDLALLQSVSYIAGALGVCVAAFYYVMNLRISQRNQELTLKALEQSAKAQQQTLETRQAQMFMNIYDKSSSKELQLSLKKIVTSEFSTWEEYQKLYNEPDFNEAWDAMRSFYEGVGVLVKEDLLNVRMMALLMCGMTRLYFEKVKPIVYEGRKVMGFSRWFSETEFLYDELMKYLLNHPELDTRIEHADGFRMVNQ